MDGTLEAVTAKTRRAYDKAAERYHDLFQHELDEKPYDRRLLDRFAARFDAASLICDAGCGPCGHIGRYLIDKGIPVVGVDISGRCVKLASLHNPGMQFAQGDLARLAFADGAFDGVVAYYSVIDTPKMWIGMLFGEFFRILRPGGHLLVAVKEGAAEGFLPELLGIEAEIYFSAFAREEISRYFQEAGLRLELLERRDPYPTEIQMGRIFALGTKG